MAESFLRTQLAPNHELQPGPGFVHGAHLHVYEPERQRDCANHVFGDVGGHARRALGPRHPDRSIRNQRFAQAREIPGQLGARRGEEMDELRLLRRARNNSCPGWKRTNEPVVIIRPPDDDDGRAGLDAELLRERRAAVAYVRSRLRR